MRDQFFQFGFNSTVGEGGIMEFFCLDGFLVCIPLLSLEEYFKDNNLENIYHGLGISTS
jgi:hypothetical protein